MKRIVIFLLMLLPLSGCQQAEDTRYFAPELSFGAEAYAVPVTDGGVDVVIGLSRPASMAFQITLILSGSLQEGVQYTVPSHTLDVAAGDTEARLHITLVDDEIWDEATYIDVLLTPGTRYTLDPNKVCSTRVNVSKTVVIPVLRLGVADEDKEVNPYLAPTVTLQLTADKAPLADVTDPLTIEGLTAGTDFLIDGAADASVVLPAGATSAQAALQILKKDQCGYDGTLTLSMSSVKGKFGVGNEGASVSIHLLDPVPNLKPLFKTAAQAGEGYQWRQAIKTPAGEWEGNLAANVAVSAEGSAYVKSLKNTGTSLGPLSNEVGLHILRLADLFPNLRKTSGDAILDYGRNSNTRGFSPVDSLFRFVLDPGSSTQGELVLNKPRIFKAAVGDYKSWTEAVWSADSKSTGGDILQSTNPIISYFITLPLEKLEGRFDLESATETMLFTAWFSCTSDEFLNGLEEKYAFTKEDGLWKLEYKIWPR